MKNNFKFLFACLLLGTGINYAQVGVGTTTPDASSMLEITSTTKGFLMPRMTTAERTAIATPANGLQVYDTTTNTQWFYNGTIWVNNIAGGQKWVDGATAGDIELVNPTGKETIKYTDKGLKEISKTATTIPVLSGLTYVDTPLTDFNFYSNNYYKASEVPLNPATNGINFKENIVLLDSADSRVASANIAQENSLIVEPSNSNSYNVISGNFSKTLHYGTGTSNFLYGGQTYARLGYGGIATQIYGSHNSVDFRGSGTTTNHNSVYAGVFVSNAAGTITNAIGYKSYLAFAASTTAITNLYSNLVDYSGIASTYTGTIASSYDFFSGVIPSTALVTNKFGIYSNDIAKNNSLLGNLLVGNNANVSTAKADASAQLEVRSTTKGFLMPRMTTAERTAIATPATGLQVYDTDTNTQWFFNGTAWVNAATAGAEWTYNGTDAIEATRALANGANNSISNNGKEYQNIGHNWSTDVSTSGGNVFGSDPKFKSPKVTMLSSDALSFSSPFSSAATGPYIFDLGRLIVTDNHISNATSTSKRYFGMARNLILSNSTTLPVADLFGLDFSVDTQAATSNVTGNLYASRLIGDHSGSGTVGTTYGLGVFSRMNATAGSITNMRGIHIQNGTNTGSMGNVSGEIRGIDLVAFHNGTGTVNMLKGLSLNTNLGASSTIPNLTQGINNLMNLASSTTGASTSNVTGYNQTVSNSSPTSFANLNGFNSSLINGSTAGAPTNVIGFNNTIANNSTSTNTIAQFTGINTAQTWSSSSNVTDFYGLFSNTNFLSTSAGTITNFYGNRIRQNRTVGSTTVTTNNYGLFIDEVAGGVTRNFSIFSNGGNVYLKDNVGIGTTAPTSKLQVVGLPVHVDNAAAVTAGLTAGAFYHSGDGIVRVVY